MKYYVCIVLTLVIQSTFAQHKFNARLKKQLDSVYAMDQKYRATLNDLMDPLKRDSVAKSLSLTVAAATNHYWKLQNHIDSLNVAFIENVFNRMGYPGKTMVGEPSNEAAWDVIQHSAKISEYLPVIKKAAEQKELPFKLYAMMLDRDLCDHNQEQVYGSQAVCRNLKNKGNSCFIWPIKNPEGVNKRRKDAGFDQTVEQNAKRLDIDYSVVKLSDIESVK